MKTLGLIGGMTWESSLEYYRIVNEVVKEKLGGLHSARCVMYSFDFVDVEILQHQGKWREATELMVDAARRIEAAGADVVVICTNTMHKMANDVRKAIGIPLLHIVDATAREIKSRGVQKVGLLGTKFTMEEEFYRGRLAQKHGLSVLIPEKEEREEVHRMVYDERSIEQKKPETRVQFKTIIDSLERRGAEGVVLGCTEIPLMIEPGDYKIPIFDTTTIHARAAAEFALGEYEIIG